jgi:hypothetical protein
LNSEKIWRIQKKIVEKYEKKVGLIRKRYEKYGRKVG